MVVMGLIYGKGGEGTTPCEKDSMIKQHFYIPKRHMKRLNARLLIWRQSAKGVIKKNTRRGV